MPVPAERYWTAEAVLELPDDGNRYECVDGVLLVSPAPRRAHQAAVLELLDLLRPFVARHGLGHCMFSPADVRLPKRNLVQPDVFVATVRLGAGKDWEWTDIATLPLVVEVLSPSNPDYDRETKRELYMRAGVPEYWIVDLDARAVERWRAGRQFPEIVTDTLVWEPQPGVRLSVDLRAYFAAVLGT